MILHILLNACLHQGGNVNVLCEMVYLILSITLETAFKIDVQVCLIIEKMADNKMFNIKLSNNVY